MRSDIISELCSAAALIRLFCRRNLAPEQIVGLARSLQVFLCRSSIPSDTIADWLKNFVLFKWLYVVSWIDGDNLPLQRHIDGLKNAVDADPLIETDKEPQLRDSINDIQKSVTSKLDEVETLVRELLHHKYYEKIPKNRNIQL